MTAVVSVARRIKVFVFSYIVCNQIWLNPLTGHHHFSYITNLKGKPCLPPLLLIGGMAI
jgi:hypothetical protein